MITIDFWITISQGHYDPDYPSTNELVFTRTYPYEWIAKVSRWFWDHQKDYTVWWSEIVTDAKQK